MRRSQPKPKEKRKVSIPDDLRDAIREAHGVIEVSRRDPDVRVDYDDAIQAGCLVGGRIGSTKRPFEFTYFSSGDLSSGSRWRLALHPLEIEDIADGRVQDLWLYCCVSGDCGSKSNDPEFLCDCDYVDDPFYGNVKLTDVDEALRSIGLAVVTLQSSRDDIVRVLGVPSETGGNENHTVLGYIWPWVKYNRTDCQLRFEFGKSGEIRGVSILAPDWVPGT